MQSETTPAAVKTSMSSLTWIIPIIKNLLHMCCTCLHTPQTKKKTYFHAFNIATKTPQNSTLKLNHSKTRNLINQVTPQLLFSLLPPPPPPPVCTTLLCLPSFTIYAKQCLYQKQHLITTNANKTNKEQNQIKHQKNKT